MMMKHDRISSAICAPPGKIGKLAPSSPLRAFFRELISNPRAIGAACPSSRGLARRMASYVSPDSNGLVVELGAGTGVVTAALLERGIAPERIIPVERSPEMAHFLSRRFPGLPVLCGDAGRLKDLLRERVGDRAASVSHVVSSLPLRSIPQEVVRAIMDQLNQILGRDGSYIQFTYDIRHSAPCLLPDFARISSKVIWLNIPPARADLFCRRQKRG